MTFRTRLSLIIVGCGLLPLIVGSVFHLAFAWKNEKGRILQLAKVVTQSGANVFSAHLDKRKAEISAYANMPLLQSMDWERIGPFLTSEIERHGGIYEKLLLGLPDQPGNYYITTGGNPHFGGLLSFDNEDPNARLKSIAQRDYWQYTAGDNPNAERRVYVSNPMISYFTGVRQIMVAATILSEDGRRVAGMVSGSIAWDELARIDEEVKGHVLRKFGADARCFLVSHNGTYVYHSDKTNAIHVELDDAGVPVRNAIGELSTIVPNITEEGNEPAEAGHRILAGESGHVIVEIPEQGRTYCFFAPVESADYGFGLLIPESVVTAPLRMEMYFYGSVGLGVLVLAAVASYLLSRKAVAPLITFSRRALEVAGGDWGARFDDSSRDEIGVLALSFNKMLSQLQSREGNLIAEAEKQKVLFSTIPAIVFIKNREGEYIAANKLFAEAVGVAEDRIAGQTDFSLFPQEEAEAYRRDDAEVMRTGKPRVNIEEMMPCADGAVRWVSTNKSPVRDASGNVVGLIGASVDITDRRRAEEAHRLSEAKFRGLVESSSDWVWEVDAKGIYTYVSPKIEAILGYEPQEVIGKTPFDLMPPDEAERIGKVFAELATAGRPFAALENVTLHKNGRRVVAETSGMPVLNEGGEVAGYIGMDHDITKRRQAEDDLRHLRNYLSNIIDSMPSVLVGVDADGRVTQWNRGAERATGTRAENAHGRYLPDVYPQLRNGMDRVREAIRSRRVCEDLKVPQDVDGERHYCDMTVYPLVANGVEGAVIRVDDVSDRVRIEEMMVQTEKMISVGGLAAGMAHEINNPLGGIIQGAQNIQRRVSKDLAKNIEIARECGVDFEGMRLYFQKRKILEFLDGIRESGARAARIVANMLQFSRRSDSYREPADLAKLIDNTVELAASDYDLKKRFDFRHIEIVRDYAPNLPLVEVVPTEIEQVILNLLKNAGQAMQEASQDTQPRLILRTRHNHNVARIEIEDNGPGMSEDVRRRVFEPFFTTKPVGAGTGLGLSVSYMIITNNHNGTMTVESTPEKGTRFIIELPLAVNQAAQTAAPDMPQATAT